MERNKILISGFLYTDSDYNITITESDKYYKEFLIDIISERINPKLPSKHKTDNNSNYDNWGEVSYLIPNCNLKFYISDNKIDLDEVSIKYTMQLIGNIDVQGESYGYSEYTIEGFNTDNFSIGNHNLNKILCDYEGKYINLIIEY